MSIKHFCDSCGVELTPQNRMTLNGDDKCEYSLPKSEATILMEYQPRVVIEVICDVCKYCVVDTLVKAIDDRPKERQ